MKTDDLRGNGSDKLSSMTVSAYYHNIRKVKKGFPSIEELGSVVCKTRYMLRGVLPGSS